MGIIKPKKSGNRPETHAARVKRQAEVLKAKFGDPVSKRRIAERFRRSAGWYLGCVGTVTHNVKQLDQGFEAQLQGKAKETKPAEMGVQLQPSRLSDFFKSSQQLQDGLGSQQALRDAGVADDVASHVTISSSAVSQHPRKEPVFIIHLIRHEHCFKFCKKQRDPSLSAFGRHSARRTRRKLPLSIITHIVCSPMARTLETARILFKPILPSVSILACSALQTCDTGPCGQGSSLEQLKGRYANLKIDFKNVAADWNVKDHLVGEMINVDLRDRIANFMKCLRALRDEQRLAGTDCQIAIVTHSSVIPEFFTNHDRESFWFWVGASLPLGLDDVSDKLTIHRG